MVRPFFSVSKYFRLVTIFFFSNMDPTIEKALLQLIKFISYIYTVVTLPIYWLVQQPWKLRAKHNQQRVSIFELSIKISLCVYTIFCLFV